MKNQDLIQYHQQDVNSLQAIINQLEKELIATKLKKDMGQLNNLHQPKFIRHHIAAIKTIIRQKQLTNNSRKTTQTE